MSALGLKTKKRHIRSPDGQAASMVQRDGFCNPRWELRCHYYCGAKAPDLAWGGGVVRVRKEALVSGPCCTTTQRIDPVTRRPHPKEFHRGT